MHFGKIKTCYGRGVYYGTQRLWANPDHFLGAQLSCIGVNNVTESCVFDSGEHESSLFAHNINSWLTSNYFIPATIAVY